MPKKILDRREVTIAFVKHFLEERSKQGELSPMQRVALDYASKLVKIGEDQAEELVNELMEKFKLSRFTAVQIANILPNSIEELKPLLIVEGRIFLTSDLEKMISLIKEYGSKRENMN